MVHGVIIAVAVSLTWILLQNLLMHWRPAKNRFKTITIGYLLSLPFILVAYRWLPPQALSSSAESPAMGLFHAYFFHLLLFLCYAECFYHVERSVTLRLLVELLQRGGQAVSLSEIQGRYNVESMISERLAVLRDQGFIEFRGDSWHLCLKGAALAKLTIGAAWLFQFKGQHERLDTLQE